MSPKTRIARSVALALILAVSIAATGTGVGALSASDAGSPPLVPGYGNHETETTQTSNATTTRTGETTEATESAETTTETTSTQEATRQETTTTLETTTTETEKTTTTETTTEATTTTTPTETAEAYPPGVTAAGVANASALVAAHEDALAETGYTFTFSENVSYTGIAPEFAENETENLTDDFYFFFNDTATVAVENGTVAPGLAPGRVVSNGSVLFDDYREEFRSDTWTNESVMLSRVEFPNELLLQRIDLVPEDGENPFAVTRDDVNDTLTKADIVNLTLHSGEFEVAKVEETDNGTLFTLESVAYDGNDSLYLSPENVSTYDAAVVVDEQGRVHRLSLTVEGTEYEHVYIHYEFELTGLGPVEVSRPPWTERLRH